MVENISRATYSRLITHNADDLAQAQTSSEREGSRGLMVRSRSSGAPKAGNAKQSRRCVGHRSLVECRGDAPLLKTRLSAVQV